MNKVFKVVWNKARGCYVVASEFAKSHTKSGRSMKAMVVATAVALTLGVNGLALASGTIEDIPKGEGAGIAIGESSKAETANDTAVGKHATADGAEYEVADANGIVTKHAGNATAIGTQAEAKMADSTAVGVKAQALTGASTAIGMGAKANAMYEYTTEDGVIHVGNATAVGVNAQALGADSTALGVGAQALAYNSTALGIGTIAASNNSTAVGNAKVAEEADNGTALGNGATVGKGAKNGTALGGGATVSAGAVDGTAVGVGALADKTGSTALGDSAHATGQDGTALGTATLASGQSSTAVGIGAHATGTSSMAMGVGAIASGANSTALSNEAKAYGNNSIALGLGAIAGVQDDGIAIGNSALAESRVGTALGARAKAYAEASTALGVASEAHGFYSTAVGVQSKTYGQYSIAIGHTAIAGVEGENIQKSIAIGDDAQSLGTNSLAFGISSRVYGSSGIAIGDGATIGVSGGSNTHDSIAIGKSSGATGLVSMALGREATASKTFSMALGVSSTASGERGLALGYEAKANDTNSVALGANSATAAAVATSEFTLNKTVNINGTEKEINITFDGFAGINPGSTVSIGTVGQERTLTNVAAGRISESSTDAINGSQLYSVINGLPEQFHTVNGNDKDSSKGEKADVAPDDNGTHSDKGNLLIAKNVDTKTGDTTYDISLNNALDLGKDGSIKFGDKTIIKDNSIQVGDTYIDNSSVKISGTTVNNKTYGDIVIKQGDVSYGDNIIKNVGTTTGGAGNEHDVVNVEYLQQYVGKNSHAHTVNGADNNGVGMAAGEKYNTDGNLLIKAEKDKDGNILSYDISMNKELNLGGSGSIKFGDKTIIKDNSIQVGDTYIDNSSVKISGTTVNNKTYGDIVIKQGDVSYGDNIIKNVGTTTGGVGSEHDVVNVEYLQQYVSGAGNTDTHIQAGEYKVGEKIKDGVQMNIVDKGGKTTGTVTITDVAKASDVADIDNRVTKIEGDVTNIKGDITDIKTDISNIGDRVTTIEGDITDIRTDITNIEKVAGQHTEVTVEGNAPENGKGYVGGNLQLKVDKDTNGKAIYDIKLNKDIDLGTDGSLTVGKTTINENNITTNEIKVGGNTTITGDSVNVGDTHITNKQITVGDKVTINDNSVKVGDITINEGNIDMGGNKITNIADGSDPKDAVNVSQLEKVENKVLNNSVQINKLGSRIDKVGAGAAALAALHPLDFDPDDKFYLSAGYGNYRGENAVAVGAFYQPNDDTLFSISSTVGNDDDMINADVTWRFGQSSHQSRSKKAMAKEIIELRTEVAELKAMVYSLTGYGMNMEKSKLFPDTPENHWAYDYVAVVAGNGILEGYPDGYFDGERPMTRYEMAAVVYRLLQKGVQVDNRMIQEFAPELARVRVDTLTYYNDGTPNIQRVRVIEGRG